jgi:hypothetical protein
MACARDGAAVLFVVHPAAVCGQKFSIIQRLALNS